MPNSNNTQPLPYIVAPTGQWDGDDGNWSTFALAVGTPPQTFRVLPWSIGEGVAIPTTLGCEGQLASLSNCGNLRGVNDFNAQASRGFQPENSTSWSQIPRDPYVFVDGQNLFGSDDTVVWGTDAVAVGETTNDNFGPSLPGQLVAELSQQYFWLGGLGLGVSNLTFADSAPYQTLLSNMKSRGLIGSLSYGYSAGRSYASTIGSLILGGYDDARIKWNSNPPPLQTVMTTQQSLQIGVESITASNTLDGSTQQLLPNPITATIDSSVSQLWLPADACQQFVNAFGLTYSASLNYYYLNETIHQQLWQENPSLSISVGTSGGATTTIQLPYSAFDLNLTLPIVNGSLPYFPLRQAANASQYTLGRVFLQEAYLIVDWERGNFTVGQATTGPASIQPITALGAKTSSSATPGPSTTPTSHGGISAGAIAGIVIVIIALAAGTAGFWLFRQRRKRRHIPDPPKRDYEKAEAVLPEVQETTTHTEYYPPEKQARQSDKPAFDHQANEVFGPNTPELDSMSGVHEMDEHRVHEMEAQFDRQLMSTPVYEMEGDQLENELGDSAESPTRPELGAASRSFRHVLGSNPSIDAVAAGSVPADEESRELIPSPEPIGDEDAEREPGEIDELLEHTVSEPEEVGQVEEAVAVRMHSVDENGPRISGLTMSPVSPPTTPPAISSLDLSDIDVDDARH